MKYISTSLLMLLFILTTCGNHQAETSYYLSLQGQSDTWELSDYEVIYTSEKNETGNGKLRMKEKDNYVTDSFHFETHAVTSGKDHIIHSGSVSGKTNIAEQTTGALKGEDNHSNPLQQVENIYMIVAWWDLEEDQQMEERIDLYEGTEQEHVF
jgi:hypothetical protein